MAVALPSYPMEGTPRGYGVIIINNFNAIPTLVRKGADKERENFQKLFELIGLECRIFENLKKEEIIFQLKMISKEDDLEKHSMIAIAISSHGGKDGLYGINIEERLERMKNKESLEGLNDTVTLDVLKEIFSSTNCAMLNVKPKLLLLNGWKEGAKDSLCKTDAGPPDFSSARSDFFVICSSFDIPDSFSIASELPASIFPSILTETLLKYKAHPLNTLTSVISGELTKVSKGKLKVKGKNFIIVESCMSDTTLQLQLQLFENK